MAKSRKKTSNEATLDDVVRALGVVVTELGLLKRLVAKYMVYHGVRQTDVAKALGTTQSVVSPMIGGSGARRLELQKTKEEPSKT